MTDFPSVPLCPCGQPTLPIDLGREWPFRGVLG